MTLRPIVRALIVPIKGLESPPSSRDHVTKAALLRAGRHGWIIRRYLTGRDAWEPEEGSLRVVYPTKGAAMRELALQNRRCGDV